MIKMDVSDELIEWAKQKEAKLIREFTKMPHATGRVHVVGLIGEELVKFVVGGERIKAHKDFDLRGEDGEKIEVKTICADGEPQPDYACAVWETSFHQQPDTYYFVRVSRDFKTAWLVGRISRDDFFEKSEYIKKGEVVDGGNYTAKANFRRVRVSDLDQL